MNLVSIITPVYNSADYITEAILSVKDQIYPDWELLIVDDCSVDETEQVIRKFVEDDKRIRYFKLEKNSGAGVARNKGIQESKGKYIAFLDSDDKWYPEKLSTQIAIMEGKQYEFTYTDYLIINQESGKEIPFEALLDKVTYSDEIRFNYVACSTVIYNREKLGKVYMPDLRNRQDWALWIQLLKKTDAAYRIKKKLTIYLQRKDSISGSKFKMVKYHWFIYRRFLRHGLFKSLFLLFSNIVLHLYYMKNK
jgi:glycosyltransferase involved in cell wall biosynthesis